MEMITVTSSNIKSIGYDKSLKLLDIQFKNGLYMYHNVPETIFINLMNADSKGTYFSQYIKGVYQFTKF